MKNQTRQWVKGRIVEDINLDMQILIVDDSISMRRIVNKFLTNNGFHNLIEADNGEKALNIVKKNPIDLIISDLNMPRMDGLEFLKILKNDNCTKDIRFIMLTVEAIQKTMNRAIALNVDSYIVKPITEKMFMDEMLRVVKQK
ncbi:MAG: response regulator [Deltaproteobacteria bacterium]|nr:response regulator [Deltaproteobacteria bacterium]